MSEIDAPSSATYPSSSADFDNHALILDREDQIDHYVANALKQMTWKEQENVYYEQHGVSEGIQEKPEMVNQCLEEMEARLCQLKGKITESAEAFRLAESQSREYVSNRNFCIKCLRAESFDSSKAAGRIICYFDFKRLLFGEEKLCKDITIKDLNEDDIKAH
jgi:hypothetical protein